ncbi:hypothetical protein BLNAU_5475 [Blattamonas nauphoetae]|uniref:Protein kinase domain-containing protein n=1 Tax=Blattamonas nauphoetae TaxID=2049346 RepID=A0ABQ9Y6N6_9EUKA|nr:hypothetical protein BLNAU_5475 [Blattamonas nauphoetae]
MECSPLIVCGDIAGHGSHMQIIRSTHISNSNLVLPLVGTCGNPSGIDIGTQVMTDQTTNSDSLDRVSISGVGLLMTNQHFALGTGPLFTFHTADALTRGMSVETSLLRSTLVNVSSSSTFSPSEQQFGSEVSQRVVGSCVKKCTNHDSGTGMMSPNLGGNFVCLNTSFSSCIRERNTVLEYSFENRTNTSTPARLNNVSSDVTSVSFTLCTFNEMAISSGWMEWGAAIFLKRTFSSLTIKQCFFSKCTDDTESSYGGAIHFWCEKTKKRPFTVSASSFTECSTHYQGYGAANQGGSIAVHDGITATIEHCFFELSDSVDGGALYLVPEDVTISSCAFVECTSIIRVAASHSIFRGCSSRIEPQGRDIGTGAFLYSQVTPDTFQFCDSTSGSPNVFFDVDEKKDSMLVPQITSTPTITSVDVSFSGSEATVTVETDIAIKGTLGVLLNGSNVPRLVHVVFGEPTVVSKVGTAVVSCGSNGVLPIDTTYIEHKWTLASFPRPAIHALVSAELEDSNTIKIVLSGVRIYEGEYWMPIGFGQFRRNVTLTRSGSDTLIGRAPLHPLTAPERLEWSMRYMVNQVYWRLPDGVSEEEAVLTKTITFTTPDAPIRITDASCSLEEDKQKSALVTLTGMKLGGDKDFNITVRKMDGSSPSGSPIVLSGKLSGASSLTSHTLSVLIFGATNPPLSFGATYVITEFDVDGSVSVVDAGVTFDVPPEPPRITGVESRRLTNDLSKMIVVLEGRALNSRTGKVNLTDGTKTWESLSNVVVVDSTHCTAEFGVGEAETVGLMKCGSSYTLKGMWSELIGFHVEDGITVIVPLPLKITNMTFSFSNTLHTGCFVTLTGTGLIVGNTLNVTLNNSLSFIATITSETEAKSAEVQIGWPSTLQHNTLYEIISIEAMNDGLASPTLDDAVTNTTGSPVDPFIIYSDSGSSSDSSLFCGDLNRPCSSIEVGWKIVEGMGVHQTTMKIIESTTLSSSINISSNKRVMITKSTDIEPTLRIPSSSSSMSGGEGEEDVVLIEVEDSFLEMESLNVVVEWSDLSLSLIAASRSTVVLLSVSIAGPKERRLWNSIDLDGGLCGWESGFLKLVNSTTTITSTQLSHLWQGAINMEGGDLTIRSSSFDSNNPHSSSFDSNNPHSSSFPSLRHNIHCSEEGEIEVGSLNGGDGKTDRPHLWLSHTNCSLSGDDVNVNAPFFIPTLSSSSTSTLNKTEKAFSLSITGTTLVPCSLMLEVFEERKDGKEGQIVRLALSEDSTESFNETHIEMGLPLSSMSTFDKNLDWCGRLVYGENETTSSFVIQQNSVDRAAQAVRENMKWWIPLLVSLVCLLVVIVIVVIICWRRRKQNNQKTEKEMQPQELDEEDVARMELEQKMDETIPDNSVDHLIKTQQTLDSHLNSAESTLFAGAMKDQQLVEVLGESGEVEMVDLTKADTLFDVLHRPEKKRVIDKKVVSRKMTKGLIRILGQFKTNGIATRFSPHWVLVNNNLVQLRLATISEGQQDGEQGTQNVGQQEKTKGDEQDESFFGGRLSSVKSKTVEGQRWRAPEVSRMNEEQIDEVSALVFSLGMVLWEVWTEEVPWKELDEANAARQNEGGVTPNLKLVVDADIRELIIKCLSFDPKDRPSLQDVLSGLGEAESKVAQLPPHLTKPSDADIRS